MSNRKFTPNQFLLLFSSKFSLIILLFVDKCAAGWERESVTVEQLSSKVLSFIIIFSLNSQRSNKKVY